MLHSQTKECSLSYEYDQISESEYQFYAISTPDNLDYFWEFGSGSTATGQNPVIELPADTSIFVCLSVINDILGCGEACDSVFTYTGNCEASFSSETSNAMEWNFISQAEGSPPLTFEWQIGGVSVGYQENLTYTFPDTGSYNVCLIITAAGMCQNSRCQEIYVEGDSLCDVSFDSEIDQQLAVFTATGRGELPYDFSWTVNDEPAGNNEILEYEFPETGTYSVCVSIETPSGCSSEYCEDITITSVSDYYYISGHVYEEETPLLSGELECYKNNTYRKTVAVSNGEFIINHLFTGEYKLKALSENTDCIDTWFGNTGSMNKAWAIELTGNTWDVDITMQSLSAVENASAEKISIYPNPFRDIIYIDSQDELSAFRITDETGLPVVKMSAVNSKGLNLSGLNPGIYFLEITSEKKIIRRKIIKL